jgi:hypothetical protein
MKSAGSDISCASTDCHSRLLSERRMGEVLAIYLYFFWVCFRRHFFLMQYLDMLVIYHLPFLIAVQVSTLIRWCTYRWLRFLRTNESDSEMKPKVTPSVLFLYLPHSRTNLKFLKGSRMSIKAILVAIPTRRWPHSKAYSVALRTCVYTCTRPSS